MNESSGESMDPNCKRIWYQDSCVRALYFHFANCVALDSKNEVVAQHNVRIDLGVHDSLHRVPIDYHVHVDSTMPKNIAGTDTVI